MSNGQIWHYLALINTQSSYHGIVFFFFFFFVCLNMKFDYYGNY